MGLVQPGRQGVGLEVERRIRGRVVVVDGPQGELTEAAIDQPRGERRRGADVHERPGVDLVAGYRIVVGRASRFDDELTDQAVTPAVDPVHMVVPEDVVEGGVGIPAVLDELGAGELTGRVVLLEPLDEGHGLGDRVDRKDLLDVDRLEPLADGEPRSGRLAVGVGADELRYVRQAQDGVAMAGVGEQCRVAHLVGADRVLVGEAGAHAVRALHVELHVVDVHAGLGEVVEGRGVRDLVGQGDGDAVTLIGADRQRVGLRRIGVGGGLVVCQHEDLAVRIGDGRRAFDGFADGHHVEGAQLAAGRAQAVTPGRPRISRAGTALPGVLAEPGSTRMAGCGERRTLADGGPQHRIRRSAVDRIEQDRGAVSDQVAVVDGQQVGLAG